MWRWVTRGLVLTFVGVLLTPVLLAQSLVGSLELPSSDPALKHSGVVLVRGWVLDPSPINRVELWIDDKFVQTAAGNLPRADVIEAAQGWPGIQDTRPGFQTSFVASKYASGQHTVEMRIVTATGTYPIGRRTITIDNTVNQPPFGFIDGLSNLETVAGPYSVHGWAIDTDGIKNIDVLVDGGVMQGAIIGEPRPDVALVYPDVATAGSSGFVANLDTTRLSNGIHLLTVNAYDRLGLMKTIGRRQIQVINNSDFLRPFGSFDEPFRDTVLYGTACTTVPTAMPFVRPAQHITPVKGWALDTSTRSSLGRVTYAELLVDNVRWMSSDDCGIVLGQYANCYGLPRFDVQRFYPTFADSPRSGFLFTLDVGALIASGVREGYHTLKVRVGDDEQGFTDLPSKDGVPVWFQCADWSHDFASLGSIGKPLSFDYLTGTVMFSGWAVDENNGVALVELYVDGDFVGKAEYGLARPDVKAQYPYIAGSGTSGWQYSFDTKRLSNSRHRLLVKVVDQLGNRSEIGAVDFYVANNPTP